MFKSNHTNIFPTSASAASAANGDDVKRIKDEIFHGQSLVNSNVPIVPLSPNELIEQLPERVQATYTNIFPISRSCYTATCLNTNQTVLLRRIHAFHPNLIKKFKVWTQLHCANIVPLLDVFTTRDATITVYQYFHHAKTMMQQYFNDPISSGLGAGANTNRPYSQQYAILRQRLLPENIIWDLTIQISSALRSIHSLGLSYRMDPSKILITTSANQFPRIRLSACGLFDVLSQDQSDNFYQELQQDDLVTFGKLLIALATNSLANARQENWDTALELVTRTYSNDLKALILTLLYTKQHQQQGGVRRTVNDIMPMIGARFYVQLNSSYEMFDNTQAELEREALNGKLFRLLVKLSMINDRPELRLDPSWSETGDRYMLKLFREYLFHQVSEDGSPWLDVGHVVSSLIKFDTGSPEKICLISRDEQHVLVVSFAELKKCFEGAFNELQILN